MLKYPSFTEQMLGKLWYDTNSASSVSNGILTAFFHNFERVVPVKCSSNIISFRHTDFPLTVVKEGWQSNSS